MDDFGTIIYIIFTIIAVVFSIIKKSNQKTNPTTPPASTDSFDPFEEDIPSFESIFGEKQTPPTPEPVASSKPTKPTKVLDELEKKKKEIDDRFARIKKTDVSHKQEVEDISKQDERWFNLREAVIYSEILKRPNL
ncbi:hypothetical protein E9993_03830 [Labilibacter sediminis]|nr:hypothetical protein E9993_03830 [Labilibacter sediminis]